MARAQIDFPTEFLDGLNQAGNVVETAAEEVLLAAAKVVEPRMRANLEAVIGKGTSRSRSTGQLAGALGTTPVKVNSKGVYNVKIGFDENRSDGAVNALIANVLEYGRSNQPARPFMAPTRSQTRAAAIAAMKQTLTVRINQVAP